jgi:ribosomal protein S28E/S33
MAVNRVYFADHNLVSEGVAVEGGVGSAIVNRSGREIQRIKAMLLAGTEPERHVLLIQSSRAALDRGQLVLAVVVAFQALEILLETKLRAAYGRQGLSEGDITQKLKRVYKTKDRLTALCREVTGNLSVADDTAFWAIWLRDCNRKRNRIVHRNEAVTHPEALKAVELCEQCMARLSALPFPA